LLGRRLSGLSLLAALASLRRRLRLLSWWLAAALSGL